MLGDWGGPALTTVKAEISLAPAMGRNTAGARMPAIVGIRSEVIALTFDDGLQHGKLPRPGAAREHLVDPGEFGFRKPQCAGASVVGGMLGA